MLLAKTQSFKMNRKYLYLIILGFASLLSCQSNQNNTSKEQLSNSEFTIVRSDFNKYFDSCNAEGSIAIYHLNKHQWILSDTNGTKKENLPASTFKIINLLIALETKVISDENEIVKWPGPSDTVKYSYRPDIYHDMSVKKAFEVSAGWVFIELAKRIGREKYKNYLVACNYGNGDLSQIDDDFWNFGAFAISPINQVMFIKSLYEEKLPFSKDNMETVKKVMITEQTDLYTICSKTGWTRDHGINTGRWVGYIKRSDDVYFFATRLLQNRKINSPNFASCRKESTRSIFKDLKVLE